MYYYADESNTAITRSARPKCGACVPNMKQRPYTFVRAIAENEWWS